MNLFTSPLAYGKGLYAGFWQFICSVKQYNISLINYILFKLIHYVIRAFDSVKLFLMPSEIGGVEKSIYSFRKRGFS